MQHFRVLAVALVAAVALGGRSAHVTAQAHTGDVVGVVIARNAIGESWSLAGANVWLFYAADDGSGSSVRGATVQDDNSFSFPGVAAGGWYVAMLDPGYHAGDGAPCTSAGEFRVAVHTVTATAIWCRR